jgi:DNA-binding transcriptional LysR family regulator
MDRLYLMSTFVAVVDCQGFAGAARKLNLSPPAVTRAVAELEERLGVQLLARTTRVVRVTEAGAAYADDCRRILAEVDEADAAASGARTHAMGHLIVTAPVLYGRIRVAAVVTAYLRAHPEVTATCWFIDRVVNLVDEGVDVAVRIGHLPDSSLHAYPVGQVHQVVCASPTYLAARGPVDHPSDLCNHTVISASAVTPGTEWRFTDGGETINVKLNPRVTTSTNDSAIAMAVEGFGVTRLMSYQAAPYIAAGTLQAVLEPYGLPPTPVHLVYREGRRASRKVRAFVETAAAMLAPDRAVA